MKRINQFFIIALIAATISCDKKDNLLIGQLPLEPIVNPESGSLLKDNRLLNFQYDGTEINGFNKTHMIATSDLFKNFTTTPYTLLPDWMQPFLKFEGDNVISSPQQYATIPSITVSVDYGANWKTLTPDIPGYNATGFFYVELRDATVLDANTLLLVTSRSATDIMVPHNVNSVWMYTVNLTSGQGQLLATIPGYMPLSVKFIDRNKGWIALSKTVPVGAGYDNRNTYIAATVDGGVTWSTPVLVDASAYMTLAAGKEGHLFLYNGTPKGYFSANGANWTASNSSSFRISDVSIVNASVIYAAGAEGVYKSTNGGLDWAAVPERIYNSTKISFIDEQTGIIYNAVTLYLTKDGGKSWKTLLYPYPFVMD